MTEADVCAQIAAAGLDVDAVTQLVDVALDEDLAGGIDITTAATVPADQHSRLALTARASGVIAGGNVAALVFFQVAHRSGNPIEVTVLLEDGSTVSVGDEVVVANGLTSDLLTGERTALNLLCHLSGVATATNEWAAALAGSKTKVRDTRKTMPLLRALQKYAVRCGGGVNHRMALSDAALVKDNHVVSAGGVAQAFAAVRDEFPQVPIEVEVDSLDQLTEVLDAGADLVLLDNFTPEEMRAAVELNSGRALLEASGGLTLADAPTIATTGVDYVAVGALTHSARVLDIGADLSRP